MEVPFSREKVIKALVNTCECIVGVILVLSVISPNSVSFAQDSSMTAYSVKNLSSDHYTLLPSPPRYIFQDMRVTGVPDIPSSRSVSTFWDPELSLQGNLQKDRPVLDWETGSGKSYLIPALEILGLNLVMNGVSRLAFPNDTENGKKVYDTNLSTFWDNLVHGSWGIDNDSFGTSQLRHPYQGAGYYGFARSAGLSYWESTAYTLGGIFLWTTGGETGNPSINDMISSGVAGPFLGESLFRMASLILEDGKPGFWRELGAAVISPPTGVNRLAFGDRFKAVFPSHDPAVFWRVRLGASWATYTRGGSSSDFEGNEGTAHFSMTYGLPGKPGYQYTRPFDYFKFEFKAGSNAGHLVENLMTYGLLLGKRYELGGSYRGIWGLYGSYDYISPDPFFRVSSTALSLGTTGQWWVSRSVALQSSILAGLAYAGGAVPLPKKSGISITAQPYKASLTFALSLGRWPCWRRRRGNTISVMWGLRHRRGVRPSGTLTWASPFAYKAIMPWESNGSSPAGMGIMRGWQTRAREWHRLLSFITCSATKALALSNGAASNHPDEE
jgi:hypothetical protein